MDEGIAKPRLKTLIGEDDLQRRVAELAKEIDRDYRDTDRLICIGVLKGSVFFMVDLLKKVQTPVSVDFFQTSSYGAGTEPGEVRIRKDIDISIRGRDVLLIEDIVDTGRTLRFVRDLLSSRSPASLRVAVLLDKPERRVVPVEVDYTGFVIPDRFVVGYGLDWCGRYRNLPYIGVLESTGES